jgi:hypothetical protein
MVAGMGIFARQARPKGQLPDDLRSELAAEGILVIEEGVPATIMYRHYRAPGRSGNWRGDYLVAFAMSERRLLVYGATPDRRPPSPFVNVSWEQAKAGGLSAVPADGGLRLCFEFSALYPDRSGQAEVLLRTGQAQTALTAAEARLS